MKIMLSTRLIIAAATGALVAVAMHADAANIKTQAVNGKFICDAYLFPANVAPFEAEPEAIKEKAYVITASRSTVDIVPKGASELEGFTLWGNPRDNGTYRNGTQVAQSMVVGADNVAFTYRNKVTGDSVGFIRCQQVRGF